MENDERYIEIEYKLLAYQDALDIAEKSWGKKEIKRHLELRISDIQRELKRIYIEKEEPIEEFTPITIKKEKK